LFIVISFFGPRAFVAQPSTLSRVFQVGEAAGTEVVSGKGFAGQNAFQVRFKLFQVRYVSGWQSDGWDR
jgi:hypothetical protein